MTRNTKRGAASAAFATSALVLLLLGGGGEAQAGMMEENAIVSGGKNGASGSFSFGHQSRIPKVRYLSRPGYAAFLDPKGIAIDSHGNVWVANAGSDSVTEILRKGGYRKKRTYGGPATHFDHPHELVIDRLDDVWVVSRHGVTALYAKDRYRDPDYYSQRQYSVHFRERYAAVDPNAPWPVSLWITGSKKQILHIYGTPGKMEEDLAWVNNSAFRTPRKTLEGAAVDDRENLVLANRGGSLITFHLQPHHGKLGKRVNWTTTDDLTPAGKHVPLSDPPVLVAVDPVDNIVTTSPDSHTTSTNYASSNYGKANTYTNPLTPRGIAIDGKGRQLVTDHDNESLQVSPFYRQPPSGATSPYKVLPLRGFHPRRIAIDDQGDVWMTGDEGVMRVVAVAPPVRTPLLGLPKAP